MNPQKFVFDTSFEEKDMASNEPLYSENHLIKHAEMHFQKGFDEGVSITLDGIHARNEAQLHIIHDNLNDLLDSHKAMMDKIHQDIGTICHHMATVLFTEISKTTALEEVKSFLDTIKPELDKHTTIVITVHPDTRPDLNEKLESLQSHIQGKGQMIIAENSDLGHADCDVTWEDGGVDRVFERSLKAVQEAAQRYAHLGT